MLARNGKICFLPPIALWTKVFSPCQSRRDAHSSYHNVLSIGRKHFVEGEGRCSEPCQVIIHDPLARTSPLSLEGEKRQLMKGAPELFLFYLDSALLDDAASSELVLFYRTSRVGHTKEVVLYDFGSIVAAVGGSLGLFLGFSCLDTGRKLLEWIGKVAGGKSGKARNAMES